jgi:L,D-transpeptidase catalytic domain/Putative peptidoglycan binding domain
MRRPLAAGLLVLALPGGAHAATLTLRAEPAVARYGQTVAFAGQLAPAQPNVPVGLYVHTGSAWQLVTSGATQADGTYRLPAVARSPGRFYAVAQLDAVTQVSSGEALLAMRPELQARIAGRRRVGERLVLTGRLLPATAGRLSIRLAGKELRLRTDAAGRFRRVLPPLLPGRVRWSVEVAPTQGYEAARVSHALAVRGVGLGIGSRGPAVRALEARLGELRHALRGIDGVYGHDTYEAVLAFQKVHGMARTGRVRSAVWSKLRRASVPRAFVPRGDHVEVSKTKQVMYEVRRGKVARIVHVSTGATGNTPVGSWRVYRLGPGGSLSHMYYSLYFLRGFAIHGYHSVPSYPASHGCVRTPLWFAPGFYARWGRIGTRVIVLP